MSSRFISNKKTSYGRNLVISLLLFALIFAGCFFGLNSMEARLDEDGLKTLQEAVTRDITRCYAEEGSYPESLDYLKEHYGLTYDEDKYFIDYQPLGENILPDVTIIQKDGQS